MDSDLITKIKNNEDKNKVIELLQEGCTTVEFELFVLVSKLKVINKEMTIDILECYLEFLNDSLSLATEYMTRKSTTTITAEQGLLIASLNSTAKSIKI